MEALLTIAPYAFAPVTSRAQDRDEREAAVQCFRHHARDGIDRGPGDAFVGAPQTPAAVEEPDRHQYEERGTRENISRLEARARAPEFGRRRRQNCARPAWRPAPARGS